MYKIDYFKISWSKNKNFNTLP